MTLETNALATYEAIGNREDLTDKIYIISPTDTPVLSMIAKTEAEAVKHEWQTDALATAANNAQLEGDAFTAAAATATSRLNNYCQISYKIPRVTGTQETVKKAGRTSEMAHQIYKRSLELKRDTEVALLGNVIIVTGSDSAARKLGGMPTWLATNYVSAGAPAGSAGASGTSLLTAGTAGAFLESHLKSALKKCWDQGGDPDCILVDSFNKQAISSFTGNATRIKEAEDSKLNATIDVYKSDFGDIEVIPDRFINNSNGGMALVLQKNMFAFATLRPFQMFDLAVTGDSRSKALLAEYTLEVRNEKSSAIIADLSVS